MPKRKKIEEKERNKISTQEIGRGQGGRKNSNIDVIKCA